MLRPVAEIVVVAGAQNGNPVIRHQTSHRRMPPRGIAAIRDDRHRWELRCDGQRLAGRYDGGRALLRIGRLQHPRDPCRPLGAEPIGELAPCRGAGRLIVAGAPVLSPVVRAPLLLGGQQIGLV